MKDNTSNINFNIVKFSDASECDGIIHCLHSAFGGTYIKPELYTAEGIIRMHESGMITLYLAKTPDGDIAGIVGHEPVAMFPGKIELCTLIVLPEYRGCGLGRILLRHLYETIKNGDYLSAFAYPIASHLGAQHSIAALDPVCCGFYPSVFSTEKFSSGIDGHTNPKDSLTIVTLPLKKTQCGTIFLPPEQLPLAEEMYNRLGAQFSADSTENLPYEDKTAYSYSYNETHCTLYLTIDTIGADIESILHEVAKPRGKWFTANINLNMCDPCAVYAARLMRSLGMLHTGFQPLGMNAEYSVFHHRGSIPLDVDDLCYTEGQRAFAENIRRQLIERDIP